MPAEELEQGLAKLEKALTEIDTARAHLVEEMQALRLHTLTPAGVMQLPLVAMVQDSGQVALFCGDCNGYSALLDTTALTCLLASSCR